MDENRTPGNFGLQDIYRTINAQGADVIHFNPVQVKQGALPRQGCVEKWSRSAAVV